TSINKSKNNNKLVGISISIVLVAFLAGILGGFIGNRIDTKRVTSFDTATTKQIVSNQSELISQLATDVSPSVVSINVKQSVITDDLFFGPSESVSEGAGTGIILSSDGVVITNRHVIPENLKKVSVTTSDGKVYDNVDVIARDPRSGVDIAFLKINGVNNLKPANLGDSANTKVGESVIAIGYALGEFKNTVTSGIISGLGRPITASDGASAETLTNLFQTDAAINPGNSGGPLVNLNGQVIGINTAVAGSGAQNIGFAIPINDVKPQIASILENGKLEIPYLGVRYVMINEAIQQRFDLSRDEGAWLKAAEAKQAVINGSPADKAGLKEGDIIFKVNGKDVNQDNPLASVLSAYNVGDKVEIEYDRDGQNQKTTATLEAAPDL
ncbi:MAG: trypsin-like peptidase domain-containing protein, partial [Patescibacteria group bacterium]|nr:trypsin-like peptidase domain-containing protein [Patescibacteria group bacterium]